MTRRLPGDPPVLVGKELRQTQEEQQRFNEDILQLGLGSPPAHGADHDVGAIDPLSGGGTPLTVSVGGAASPGSGPGYMREDAQLVVGAATPVAIGSANAAGSASTTSRGDHVHARNVEVRVNSVLVAVRRMLNLIAGTGGITIAGVDDPGGDEVDVTFNIPGAPTLYYQIVQEEGAPLTQRGKLNFVGAGVVASDDAGNDRTNVTISAAGPSAIIAVMQ